MALTPLDLQTLFLKMNEVNKVQAIVKGAAAQEQALEAKLLAEQEMQKDNSVNPSPQDADMDNRIKDEERKREEGKNEKSPNKKGDEESEKKEREYIKDPNLGNNIDLIG
jgi:hypothetical protein